MNVYEAIYSRRSVRRFLTDPVPEEVLGQIRRFIRNISSLDHKSRVEIEMFERGNEKLKGLWKVEAPFYLAVYCGGDTASVRNAGYVAEQVVLYLTSRELGTCYPGETKAGMQEKDGLGRFLVIAFGYADGPAFRDPATARRLPLGSLCVYKDEPGENLKAVLKAARLAPSSFNSQPWRFVVYGDRVYIFAKRDAITRIRRMAALRDFNIGIMLSHIMLAAEEFWMNMETVTEEQFLKKAYKNGDYVCTIVFHS